MRSTITRYSAGSPMRVPPSFTNSAATPSFLPSSFTRTMNAGGKLYSRPQRRPTLIMCVLLNGNSRVAPAVPLSSVHRVRRRSARRGNAGARFCHQMTDDRLQIARLLVCAQLAFRPGAFIQNRVNVLDGAVASELLPDILHQLQQFGDQLQHGYFRFLPKID